MTGKFLPRSLYRLCLRAAQFLDRYPSYKVLCAQPHYEEFGGVYFKPRSYLSTVREVFRKTSRQPKNYKTSTYENFQGPIQLANGFFELKRLREQIKNLSRDQPGLLSSPVKDLNPNSVVKLEEKIKIGNLLVWHPSTALQDRSKVILVTSTDESLAKGLLISPNSPDSNRKDSVRIHKGKDVPNSVPVTDGWYVGGDEDFLDKSLAEVLSFPDVTVRCPPGRRIEDAWTVVSAPLDWVFADHVYPTVHVDLWQKILSELGGEYGHWTLIDLNQLWKPVVLVPILSVV
eukprot:TRINITY_DN8481_c0_g1_i1.p1 TRINITY_DN8481_c0_g1~~TRINITY_DN8481_c0_g1_i1.p1  ORF type:complete len:296 (+),score=64.42 TRINITY_DN8481_c0_g1_i1:25-888(+)